jgi:hypothetical protein
MNKEFVPYEPSLALKELGFDEPCFKGYTEEYKTLIAFSNTHTNTSVRNTLPTKPFTAPLFQQAFGWLLKEHNLYAIIIPTITMHWTFKTMTVIEGMVEAPPYKHVDAHDYATQEEAELACLKKLIEIVKEK